MATTPSIEGRKPQAGDADLTIIHWSLVNGETGDAVDFASFADRTVQVVGTFGGATVVIEGSLDGENYATLADPQGNALSFTAAGLESVMEVTKYIRPGVSGGNGTTTLGIYLLVRR